MIRVLNFLITYTLCLHAERAELLIYDTHTIGLSRLGTITQSINKLNTDYKHIKTAMMKFCAVLLHDAIDKTNKKQQQRRIGKIHPQRSRKTAKYYRQSRENPIDKIKVPIF